MPGSEQRDNSSSSAVHLGYLLAVFVPVVGLLVGLALIVRGDEDGPWVVGYSVGSNLLYVGAVALGLSMHL